MVHHYAFKKTHHETGFQTKDYLSSESFIASYTIYNISSTGPSRLLSLGFQLKA